MEKKKAEATVKAEAEEVTKAVRLDLSVDRHRELRVEAAKRDLTMSALARLAVEEWLDKAKGKG